MLPTVNEGLSLINFLFELKDFKRMFHLWDGRLVRAGFGRKVLQDLSKLLKPGYGKYSRAHTLKNLSNAWLNLNFGWRPFIADIVAMYRALTLTSEKLAKIERDAGKLLRRNYSSPFWDHEQLHETANGSLNAKQAWGTGAPTNRFCQIRHERYAVYQPRYHATMVYTYTIPKMSELRRRVNSYLDAFGVKLDPVILWNAIPFSFIMDWFFDVGTLLRNFTPNDLGIKTTVLDFSHSIKWEVQTQVSTRMQHNSGHWLEWQTPFVRVDKYYERRKTIPSPTLLPSVQGLNKMQASLAGALIQSHLSGKLKAKYYGRISHR